MRKALELVDGQIEWVEKCMLTELTAAHFPSKTKPETRLKWTGSIVDWVELIYALHAAGVIVIDGGKATLEKLFGIMGEVFGFEVREFANYFMNIKRRVKGDRTTFLDKLKGSLLRRMEDADRKPPRK